MSDSEDFDPTLGERDPEARPGILLCSSETNRPFKESDRELLESRLELKIGEDKVKKVELSADKLQAYVELEDESDISKVLSSTLKLGKTHPALLVKRFDLMEVCHPYLIARGVEEWITSDVIKDHFEAEANGATVEFIEMHGTNARITFINPQVALGLESSTDLLGLTLKLEIGYSSPAEEKDLMLSVKGLPLQKIPKGRLKHAIVNHFSKHTGYEATECHILNGIGYLTFDDISAVKSILSNPPTAKFYAGTALELAAVPVSQMLFTDNTETVDSSSTFKQTYSCTSEDFISPNTPSSSMHFKKAFESQLSRDSTPSFYENQTSVYSDVLDPESPLNYYQRPWNPSTSSDGIPIFSLPNNSGMPRRNFPSSTSFSMAPGHSLQGPAPPGKLIHQHMQVEDLDGPCSPSSESDPNWPNKILVEDVPSHKRDSSLIEYYLRALTSVNCSVKQYGKSFLATFHQPINHQMLKEKSHTEPLDTYHLSFCALGSTRKIALIFGSQNEPRLTEYSLKLHFELFAGKGSVEGVELLSPHKASVTFKNPQSVKIIIRCQECQEFDGNTMSMEEYYDFMAAGDEDDPVPSLTSPTSFEEKQMTSTFDWSPIEIDVDEIKVPWLKDNLKELNDALADVKADASVVEDLSLLKIVPLAGSEVIHDWDKQAKKILDKFMYRFKEDTITLPMYGRADLLEYAKKTSGTNLIVRFDNSVLQLAGDSATVDEVMTIINEMIQNKNEILSEERPFLRKQIKYLKKNCETQLNHLNPPAQNYVLHSDLGIIKVTAVEEARKAFWDLIGTEIKKIQEKSLKLTHEGFDLLASRKGIEKIKEVIGMKTHIVFDLIEDPPNYTLYLFSPPHAKKEDMKHIKRSLENHLDFEVMAIEDPKKFRFCSDVKWREHVNQIQKEVFVLISVNDSLMSVTVTGEKVVVRNVFSSIKTFLSEQTSIEEQVRIVSYKWTVISKNFGQEIEGIKHYKDVTVTWPQLSQEVESDTAVTITIKGDPAGVDKVKGELEALQSKVCQKEVKLCNIPAAIQVVESIEDKVHALEGLYGAAIVSLASERDDSASGQASSENMGVANNKLCSATCPNEVRISVYSGDFTKHSQVDTVVNFIPPNPNNQEDNLKLIFAAGGPALQEDFKRKLTQYITQPPGESFMSDCGQIQCRQLCHCFISPWAGGTSNEEFYLQESLNKVLYKLRHSTRILFTSICSNPLKYPAEVFAKNIISLIASSPDLSNDLTVTIYVNDIAAREFKNQFKVSDCHMLPQIVPQEQSFSPIARSVPYSISSYITLEKGDLLQQQAEVYINSTNTKLDLKTGSLSDRLLKACGDELQKKCSEYAPLKPEVVAITEAKNLKADFIYHVALPNHQHDLHALRKFKGTVQAILHTAKKNGVKSLAIPSLGVGNLHYPAQTSAKILFEEIIAFQAQNPGSNMKFYFVIFDQDTHKEFNKVYTQKVSSETPPKGNVRADRSYCRTRLTIKNSDISEEESDVIVNTTTEEMKLSDSAVSNALLKKAGPMLQEACDQLIQSGLKLDHGQIVETKSFGSLRCKKIIHAHVPPHSDAIKSGINPFSLIVEIVTKCLNKAESLGLKSISFPAFGFGLGGYSVDQVAEPMLTAFRDFGHQNPKSIETIKVVIFDQKLHKQFFDFFANFFHVDTSLPHKIISTIKLMLNPKGGHAVGSVELQDGAVMPQYHGIGSVDSQLILFKMFASSDDVCTKIESKLREFVKEKSTTECVTNEVISMLIDADIDEIKKIGISSKVHLNVQAQINKIEILGETSRVKEAKYKITDVINEIKRAVESKLILFQWHNESSDTHLEQYSDHDSFKLERAKAKNLQVIEMVIDGIEVVVDLNRMEETSKKTGDVRKVMRTVKKLSLPLPDTWKPQPVDDDGNELPIHMFAMTQGLPEYQEALEKFHATIGQTVTIVSLKRIQNPVEYRRHVALQDSIAEKYHKQKIDVKVKQLFHGSQEDNIKKIASQGFNRNFAADANAAVFGKGVYFALNSSYSAQRKYAVPNKDGHQFMFICRVIIGEYTVGNGGMKVAPPLQKDSNAVYDTLVDKQNNPTVFVAMTDAQAYPEYLVTFKVEK